MTEPTAPPHLSAKQGRAYEAIFRHPAAHNLEWHDALSLLGVIGEVSEGHDGTVRVRRAGRTLALHAPKHKDVPAEDVAAIRRFLETPDDLPPPGGPGAKLVVVIDHSGAKVYRAVLPGTVPECVAPDDPQGRGGHLHSHTDGTDGKHRPERKGYYDAVAETLAGAGPILVMGSGTGESSAMAQLLAELKHHHPAVAARVAGSLVIDAGHLTEGQLLARGREFFARAGGT